MNDIANTDFFKILDNLQKLGFSQKEIAKEIGVTQGMISQFKTGRIKKFNFLSGVKLIEFYPEVKNSNSNKD